MFEAELLEKEQHYASVQEEVAGNKKVIRKLRQKLRNANNELKDIHKENAEQNKDLLETVRAQAKELDFFQQVVGYLMNDDQMYKIKDKTEWDEGAGKWSIPPFIIKQKEVQLPKLGMAGKAFIDE
jgi:septal ring factor EnvC (AmiA/AmiB activator)